MLNPEMLKQILIGLGILIGVGAIVLLIFSYLAVKFFREN